MRITFCGGAQTVTGSKYLIETEGYKLLLDCGLFQGKRDVANLANRQLPFDATSVSAVILSHAHADHCGMLPVLVKQGFAGKIYCTAATADIATFILQDAAMIQEQDCEYFNKHLPEGGQPIAPTYTLQDAKKVPSHFAPVPYFRLSGQWTHLAPGVRFKFYDAGHILGSVITLLEITESGEVKRLIFTGDLGRHFLPILRDPEFVQESAGAIIMEATYGDRLHRPIGDLEGELETIIAKALQNKSKIIVPAFSLGRTQELIYLLHKLTDEGKIPALPIFVDSPLAEKITRVFNTYTSDFDEQFWEDFGEKGEKAFIFDNLVTVRSVQESKEINARPGPCIVIAGSGMCEGGRVLHHLKNTIYDANDVVLITGYQAEHTLGRKLIEGISPVKIFGRPYDVRAKIITLNELSAHADQNDLLNYVKNVKDLKQVFLVHTEPKQAGVFKELLAEELPKISVDIPKPLTSQDM